MLCFFYVGHVGLLLTVSSQWLCEIIGENYAVIVIPDPQFLGKGPRLVSRSVCPPKRDHFLLFPYRCCSSCQQALITRHISFLSFFRQKILKVTSHKHEPLSMG